jgi:hypothetical protein
VLVNSCLLLLIQQTLGMLQIWMLQARLVHTVHNSVAQPLFTLCTAINQISAESMDATHTLGPASHTCQGNPPPSCWVVPFAPVPFSTLSACIPDVPHRSGTTMSAGLRAWPPLQYPHGRGRGTRTTLRRSCQSKVGHTFHCVPCTTACIAGV